MTAAEGRDWFAMSNNLKRDASGDTANFSVKDGQMHLHAKGPDSEVRILLSNVPANDCEVQVSTALPTTPRKPDADGFNDNYSAGLIFWASDRDNHYQFRIKDKHVSVSRVNKGAWTHPLDNLQCAAVKMGGQWNDLRVVTKGTQMTCYLNGKQICQLDGEPPAGASKVGLYASDTQENDFIFKNFSVKY
jgi:hypothetical protein